MAVGCDRRYFSSSWADLTTRNAWLAEGAGRKKSLCRNYAVRAGMSERIDVESECRYVAQRLIGVGMALAVVLSAQSPAKAQGYPSHPVKIIVPFPAGGTADVMPRIFSEWL